MAADLSQDGRMGVLTTPAGKDVLVLTRFEGSEALGELFEFRVGALSTQENFDFNALLGKNIGVKIIAVDGLERYFNGVLVEARWTGEQDELNGYQLVLRPWLYLLSRTSDCRIFSQMSPVQIIKQVFQDRGFPDVDDALSGSYPTLEYCVQYRESDLNFVCRMMEQYGIYYYFKHTEDKHTLTLCDSPSCHKPIPDLKSVPYIPIVNEQRRDQQQFDSWTTARSFQTGRYTLNDYNYEQPGADLEGDGGDPGSYEHGSMELYDYPGGYDSKGEGTTLAKVRVEAEQARDDHRLAIGSATSLFPGGKMTLEKGPVDSEDKEYLVLRATHSFLDQSYMSGGGAATAYSGSYELMDATRQYRSPLVTPKSLVQGTQSALVVGKQGEEIDVDGMGRICVQFYWNRDKKKASRRIRVAQFWAGLTRGAMSIPRIGDEVMVQYEDGDPDRPIAVGSVYNGANLWLLPLPANKTISGLRTKSSTNSDGYHFLLFEDKVGQEYVALRSQKDLSVEALNDEARHIHQDHKEAIDGHATQTIGSGLDQTVTGEMNVEVDMGAQGGGDYTLTVMQTMNLKHKLNPLVSIVMDVESITLTAGVSSIRLDATGITMAGPMLNLTGMATVNVTAPMVNVGAVLNTPSLIAGAALVSGIPV